MMEVNRLNPTKSIRIGGISHFAFVNGWLLRGWGGVAVSRAMHRKRAPVLVVQPLLLVPPPFSSPSRRCRRLPLLPFNRRCWCSSLPRRTAAYLWLQWESACGTMGRRGQPPECISSKRTGLSWGCSDLRLSGDLAPLWRSTHCENKKLSAFAAFLRLGTPACFPQGKNGPFRG